MTEPQEYVCFACRSTEHIKGECLREPAEPQEPVVDLDLFVGKEPTRIVEVDPNEPECQTAGCRRRTDLTERRIKANVPGYGPVDATIRLCPGHDRLLVGQPGSYSVDVKEPDPLLTPAPAFPAFSDAETLRLAQRIYDIFGVTEEDVDVLRKVERGEALTEAEQRCYDALVRDGEEEQAERVGQNGEAMPVRFVPSWRSAATCKAEATLTVEATGQEP